MEASPTVSFNLAEVVETVEAAVPERPCIIQGGHTLTYGDIGDRSRRLANVLLDSGLGTVTDPASGCASGTDVIASGQDHLAICLHNSSEYLESMLGAFKARVVPFNVNYRYTAEELLCLLTDSKAKALVFHSAFAPIVTRVLDDLADLTVVLQVRDDSGEGLIPGARWYDEVIDSSSPIIDPDLRSSWSGDDHYMLYTGGTTGSPKGVLWHQSDIFAAAMGGRRLDNGQPWASYAEIAANAERGGARILPASPFMHGAAHWLAFVALTNANTIVLPEDTTSFDPGRLLDTVERQGVDIVLIVGDAFGRPLVESIEDRPRSLDSLLVIVSGGAGLSPGIKQRLVEALPTVMVLDGLGASETGTQASHLTAPGQVATSGCFVPTAGTRVISADRTRFETIDSGDPLNDDPGWLAQSGHIPVGYLGDRASTDERFITVEGERCALTGDRARVLSDGRVELLGRESFVINTGGEKVFAEEVETALLSHSAVHDCVVVGLESQRWGQKVTAVVQINSGADVGDAELIDHAAATLARFKLPKAIVRVEHVERSPAGKPDYRWARQVASSALQSNP
ncbi:MAG: AMP-binding protein [Microthrixaceae bacterium]